MIALVYDRYESGEHYIHDVDNDVYYTVSGSFVPNSSAAVEWVRNYGINRRATIASGIHTKLTYDTYGIITSGTNATTADINDSIDRRYVTDAMLASIGGSVVCIQQRLLNTLLPVGVSTAATIPLAAPEANKCFTVKVWLKAAANQNDKKLYARINADVNLELFNITKKYDDEPITITIEGICGNSTGANQAWVSTIIAFNENANHSSVSYADLNTETLTNIVLTADLVDNGDLKVIGYSSSYSRST